MRLALIAGLVVVAAALLAVRFGIPMSQPIATQEDEKVTSVIDEGVYITPAGGVTQRVGSKVGFQYVQPASAGDAGTKSVAAPTGWLSTTSAQYLGPISTSDDFLRLRDGRVVQLPSGVSITNVIRGAVCSEFCGAMPVYILTTRNGDTIGVDSNGMVFDDHPTDNIRSFLFLNNIFPQDRTVPGRFVVD